MADLHARSLQPEQLRPGSEAGACPALVDPLRGVKAEGRRASPGRPTGPAIGRRQCTALVLHVFGCHKALPPDRRIAAPRPVDARLLS